MMRIVESNRAAATLVALFMLALAGCNIGTSPDVTYVVVTGEAVTTSIPPTPTPDIPPEIALQIADDYLLNGYYGNALSMYESILARGDEANPEIRASAAFGMGQAALREGLFEHAVDAFTMVIAQFPQDFHAVLAYFLRGDAYLGLSRWQDAVNDFQQYLTLRPGIIDSYAYERIGDAQLALDQFDAAFASYSRAAESNRSLVPQLILREKIARLYIRSGQVDRAVEQYDAILDVAQNAPYRASIEFMAAEALVNSNLLDRGLARMQRIFEEYETLPEAYRAMNLLLEHDRPLDSYSRGRVSYFFGDYESAVESFNAYTTQVPLTNIPAELYLLLGRAYRQLGNSEAALVAFQTVIDQYPTDPLFADALLERGRTAFLNGEIDTAIERYLQIADNFSYLTEAASEALWRAGYLYGTNGNPGESQVIFTRLADTYPDTEQARSGLFIAASAALQAGDDSAAETLYTRLANTTTGEDRASAYLQVGRLALERGDQQQASDAFNQAIAAAPDTYYSARAQDLLAGRQPFTPPAQYIFEFNDLDEVTAAEDWLRATFGITQEGPLWPLSPELETEQRIVRGRELWAVGAFEAAQTEFLDLLEDYRSDGLASYQIAVFLQVIGAYYPSVVAAANVISAAGVATLDAPPYIARMRYPAYYRDVVLDIVSERGIDPLLMLSLIRHESLFDAQASGAAQEKGLTQVIPSTGEYIAGELNWPDYQHRDLFRPYASIEFGAHYLDEQLERFDGNTYAALAGYNAGPGRARDWLRLSGGDPDVFMSTITIDSVKTYIQSIYRNYTMYRELYGAD